MPQLPIYSNLRLVYFTQASHIPCAIFHIMNNRKRRDGSHSAFLSVSTTTILHSLATPKQLHRLTRVQPRTDIQAWDTSPRIKVSHFTDIDMKFWLQTVLHFHYCVQDNGKKVTTFGSCAVFQIFKTFCTSTIGKRWVVYGNFSQEKTFWPHFLKNL